MKYMWEISWIKKWLIKHINAKTELEMQTNIPYKEEDEWEITQHF